MSNVSEYKSWIRKNKKYRGGNIPIFELPKRPPPPKPIKNLKTKND